MLLEGGAKSGLAQLGKKHGMKVGDRGDRQVMPAAEVARRDEMLHLMSILQENFIVEVMPNEATCYHLTNETSQHQPGDDGKLVSHLEDNKDGRDRRLHDRAETRAHPADREQELVGLIKRESMGSDPGDERSAHPAKEKVGREDAAAAAEAVARDRGDQFPGKE